MKKQRNNINGWINLDKPKGISSAKAVAIIKRIFNAEKVGHAGTLDPMATGILPIALGEATKTIQFIQNAQKTYSFTIKFGSLTDTDDAEGEIIDTTDIIPTKEALIAALPEFTGEIEQIPPIYSAIKVNGERSYKLAREGKEIELKARKITIDSLELVEFDEINNTATLEMSCEKGTYVRSLARDLAKKLGSLGHVTILRRTKVGIFNERGTILLDKLEKTVHNSASFQDLEGTLLLVEEVLDDIPVLHLDEIGNKRLRQGQLVFTDQQFSAETICALFEGKLVAICTPCEGNIKPVRVFRH